MNDVSFTGLPVRNVTPGSPAELAGVQIGDEVIIANSKRIQSMQQYIDARSERVDGMELTVLRGNQMLEFRLNFGGQR